jgi:hypothetical protein
MQSPVSIDNTTPNETSSSGGLVGRDRADGFQELPEAPDAMLV